MEDQTKNRIREEWRKKFHNLVCGTIVNKGKLLDTWSPSFTLEEMEDFIAELLKSQRDGLVEKIKKLNDFADSGDTLKSRIINLIKNN